MMKHTLFVFLGFALLGCLHNEGEEWGAVLPTSEAVNLMKPCSRDFPAGLSGYWKPSREHLASLENRLSPLISPALTRAQLGSRPRKATDYRLQYAGFYRRGKKVIYVNAVDLDIIRDEKWQHQAVIICDGGESTFGIVYDIETKRFDSLDINGQLGAGPSVSLDGLQ